MNILDFKNVILNMWNCDSCQITIKKTSKYNHLKSSKHLKCIPLITILENPKIEWSLETYLQQIKKKIDSILSRPEKMYITYDILDSERHIQEKKITLQVKHRQMKYGEIWQVVLGHYKDFEDLKIGHPSGLDILSKNRKIIVEIKNRTNTDNTSAKKTNYQRLSNFKKKHPEYTCVYGAINDKNESKTSTGYLQTIMCNDTELQYLSGYSFLKFILGDDTDTILKFIRQVVNDYYQ